MITVGTLAKPPGAIHCVHPGCQDPEQRLANRTNAIRPYGYDDLNLLQPLKPEPKFALGFPIHPESNTTSYFA
jgi:hypothetical protein